MKLLRKCAIESRREAPDLDVDAAAWARVPSSPK